MKNLILGGRNIVIGRGALESLQNLKAERVFIVTGGKSMLESGVIARIEKLLAVKGCQTYVYSGIKKNPDTVDVLGGLGKMRDFRPDLIIAVGGGSPIDAAKVMALLYEHPEITFDNILTVTLPEQRSSLKFIAIPSTSGTGSEVTRAAVITFRDSLIKIGLKTPAFIPDVAILDADLTMTMPGNVVAETGMDAMTHAVECFINSNLDDFTECLAQGAVEGLFTYLPVSYQQKTVESREKVHHYQCLAGIAFDNVGLGMAHGISHAIGGLFDLGHGLTNAIALPYVLEYNAQDERVNSRLSRLARLIGQSDFIAAIRALNQALHIPVSFKEAGIDQQLFEDNFKLLVKNSLKGSTRVNPVPVSEQNITDILSAMFYGKGLSLDVKK
ncbi:Aldehyde-alcohol dehydrogenase [bioreactor metagenome]|uniref:Aldehyde-alcohol dehydrogenase n=1 Tax=bioreactor metagenome TaxID=1076179 RepID=A0A644TFB8_9ZZZZ|nr:iron-containing alcohol dehydrogenase [Negativicutes bacterium]